MYNSVNYTNYLVLYPHISIFFLVFFKNLISVPFSSQTQPSSQSWNLSLKRHKLKLISSKRNSPQLRRNWKPLNHT